MSIPNIFKGVAAAVAIAATVVYVKPIDTNQTTFMLPSKTAIAAARASNALFKPTTRPVALFFGGTSGIGQAMAEQLARQTNGKAHIILLGRNQTAAEKIIASFPRTDASVPPEEASQYSFVKLDATSMADIRQVTSQLSSQLPKINFIVTSTGYLTTKGRDESPEGIDRKLACNFYARFRFIHDLAPLVEKAAENGEQTGVVSVLAAGRGGRVDLNDLGLVKTFSLRNAEGSAVTYTDSMMQEFAARYPKVPFYHNFPGMVTTPMSKNLPGASLLLPLLGFMTSSPEQCAQIMWWRLWSSESQWKTGAHQINQQGTELAPNPHVIWNHAIEVTGERK
ncbi:NAD(P)-binding protein [Serendipita vermifera]|nr:NAD(P)-binding protein [Serendipita vermifera]